MAKKKKKKKKIVPYVVVVRLQMMDETLNEKCWEKLTRRVQKGLILFILGCTSFTLKKLAFPGR